MHKLFSYVELKDIKNNTRYLLIFLERILDMKFRFKGLFGLIKVDINAEGNSCKNDQIQKNQVRKKLFTP